MKKIFALLLVAVLSTTAIAGSVSRGGGSFSPSRPSVASAPRNMGMTRPNVTPSKPSAAPDVRTSPNVAPPAPSTYNAPAYAAPAPVAPSAGSTFMSSMGGAVVGSMIGNALTNNHGSTTVVTGGGAAPVAAPVAGQSVSPGVEYAAPATVVAATQPSSSVSSSIWSFLFGLIGLVLIAALIWAVVSFVRRYRSERAMNTSRLPFSPVALFLEIQHAFAAKDVPALRNLLGGDLLDQLVADLPDEPTKCKLAGISYEVLDIDRDVISIAFKADDLMDNTKLNETWHFVRDGKSWVLNGIEQN